MNEKASLPPISQGIAALKAKFTTKLHCEMQSGLFGVLEYEARARNLTTEEFARQLIETAVINLQLEEAARERRGEKYGYQHAYSK